MSTTDKTKGSSINSALRQTEVPKKGVGDSVVISLTDEQITKLRNRTKIPFVGGVQTGRIQKVDVKTGMYTIKTFNGDVIELPSEIFDKEHD